MADDLLKNQQLVVFYFAAVLVLLLLVIMQLYKVGFFMSERMNTGFSAINQPVTGINSNPATYNAGGNGSRFTEFTHAGASEAMVGVRDIERTGTPRSEWLVNNRGEPDFWTIDSELGDYQTTEGGDARATGAQLLAGSGQALAPGTTAAAELAASAEVAAAAANAATAAGAAPAAAAVAGAAAAERFRSERRVANWSWPGVGTTSFQLAEHNDMLTRALAGH